jgi:dUTP pyrophosphatase
MTKESTPPPPESSLNVVHEPPSLPASPLPKRNKPSSTNTITDETQSHSIASVMASSNGTTTAVTSLSQPTPPLLVKKLVETARAPTRGSPFAAGYDLYSAKEMVIPAKGKGLVDTGISIAVPEGTCTF